MPTILLSSRKYPDTFVLVDETDLILLKQCVWYRTNCGGKIYAVTKINGKTIYMHRLIMGFPLGIKVDHKNGNGLDNSRSNLRLVSNQQNSMNSRKLPKRIMRGRKRKGYNSSQYKGVSFNKILKTYVSKISFNGVAINIASFHRRNAEVNAAYAYNCVARYLFKDYANLNILPDNFFPSKKVLDIIRSRLVDIIVGTISEDQILKDEIT